MLVYATAEDLAADPWQLTPVNAAGLLRSASLLVRGATTATVYDVNETGLPTDATVLAAFKDATCAQATAWDALGIDPTAGAAGAAGAPIVAASSIGSAQVQYGVSLTLGDKRAEAAVTLCSDAVQILRDAGLLSGQPLVYG